MNKPQWLATLPLSPLIFEASEFGRNSAAQMERERHRGSNRGRGRGSGRGRGNGRGRGGKPAVGGDKPEEEEKQKRALRFSKEVKLDYGFVSRGEDDRLQKSPIARQEYFRTIVERFMTYCESNSKNELRKLLNKPQTEGVSIDSVLLSLRKLREALLTVPADAFTVKVFLFSIRVASSIGQFQTYLPAINHMLKECKQLLKKSEIEELATLLILHLSHFNNHNSRAFTEYFKYFKENQDPVLLGILKSWSTGNYVVWVKLYNSQIDNCKAAIMRFGVKSMVEKTIAAVQKSYFNLTKTYLDAVLLPNGVEFDTLREKYGVKWDLEGDTVVVRRRALKVS